MGFGLRLRSLLTARRLRTASCAARGRTPRCSLALDGQCGHLGLRPFRLEHFVVWLACIGLDDRQVATILQQRLDGTVVQQVRVASNGRGEVRVGVIGQAEVPLIIGRVDGSLHRPQHHRLQERRIGSSLDLLRQYLIVLRARAALLARFNLSVAQPKAGTRQELAQLGQPVGARAFMHPIERRMLVALQEIGRAGVGGQHAFLDQLVGIVATLGDDPRDASLLVAEHLGFGRLELDGPPLLASGLQRLVERMQVVDLRQHRFSALDGSHVLAGQDAPDLVVGQPRRRIHHGRIELIGNHFAVGVDHHVGHQHQPVHLRVDRAQPVGELLGQHGNDPTREIHRGGALLGLGIQRAARAHIMTDIGNGHQQPPAAGLARLCISHGLAVDGIIKVAGVLTVDRHQRHVAQVHAVAVVGWPQAVGQRPRLGQHGIIETVRHIELAHGDLDLHARIVHVAQHFDHAADGRRVPARRRGDLHRHHLPGLRPLGATGLNQDVVLDALIFGSEDQHAPFLHQAAHHGPVVVLRHLDDLAFRPPPVVRPHAAHQHPVTVHDLGHFTRRQEDVGAAIVRQHETEAVSMPRHAARNEVDATDQHQGALAPGQDLTVTLHGGHTPPHSHQGPFGHPHALDQLLNGKRCAFLGQRIQDGLSAGGIQIFF